MLPENRPFRPKAQDGLPPTTNTSIRALWHGEQTVWRQVAQKFFSHLFRTIFLQESALAILKWQLFTSRRICG